MLNNSATRSQAITALGGAAGDALARLDFGTADQPKRHALIKDQSINYQPKPRCIDCTKSRYASRMKMSIARHLLTSRTMTRMWRHLKFLIARPEFLGRTCQASAYVTPNSLDGLPKMDFEAMRLTGVQAQDARLSRAKLMLADAAKIDLSRARLDLSVATYACRCPKQSFAKHH